MCCIATGFIFGDSVTFVTGAGSRGPCFYEGVLVIKSAMVVLSPLLIYERCNSNVVNDMRLKIHSAIFMRWFMGINSSEC